ncbi:Serine/threonine-protein kinase PrkC [Fundidesulfovibrio magnetotacticus]|uniref:Serine/threonine-protein kinase PrkC n=1 Tax=Fundidesulfovibrio magnetotacticus TaxID=2730080 RepID=A0A6V8LP84_9BACT|nr:DUF1566 domain-containing protein [Fundidesulfovibrio magnetotacticus]GFK93534.1 Serine/threonine-protein kinase PrkC [Fundidesulfovibrio magnetotacticus]
MRRIGRYRIRGLLGRGGMGAVYKVEEPVTGRIHALKLLAPRPFLESLWGRREIERRFVAEAVALAGLDHPNIAAVRGFGRSKGRPYFLMDYFCRDLGQVLGESDRVEEPTRALPLPRATGYALQTLEGLARLHHAGLVHRDIKPFNLLISGEDQVKITDFGLSRTRGAPFSALPGLKVGSPYYAAPEQEDDPDSAGPRADLYSLGVTLHRMLTGLLPDSQGPKPSEFSPDLDHAWDDFFLRILAPDPAERHRDAAAAAAELRVLVQAWRRRLERACRMAAHAVPPPRHAPGATAPQTRAPLRISGRHARELLGLDHLWRPEPAPVPQLERQGGVVHDAATGLDWQTGGSPYAQDWHEAHAYARHLHQTSYAGRDGWRLPTAQELASLLTPPARFAEHCETPPFDPAQRLLWSADRRTFTQAWFADLELGALSWADTTCPRHVRAVRMAQSR